MEIEKRPPEIAKKSWNMVGIVLYMMRRSKTKRKIMVELDILLKKGKNAGKAVSNLILHHHHHYSALTCRSTDTNTAFISPREVEFSCSNTPLYPSSKRKNHHYQAQELKLMHKVFGEADVNDDGDNDDMKVDKDAEEFIRKFYTELKKQKPTTLESPSPYHEWAT